MSVSNRINCFGIFSCSRFFLYFCSIFIYKFLFNSNVNVYIFNEDYRFFINLYLRLYMYIYNN